MEYEYSFKVPDLTPYHKYCKENGYELLEVTNQSRTLYRHTNKTMARITIKECNNTNTKTLDFKEDKLSDDVLIERKESEAITFTDDAAVDSILEFLEYKKDNTLIRKRYVYKLADIKFEIDEYTEPEVVNVVAIEGEKTNVDILYQKLIKII